MSGKHTTTWEDNGIAGFRCDGISIAQIVSSKEERKCSRCHAMIRLRWDVSIVVTRESAHDGKEGA